MKCYKEVLITADNITEIKESIPASDQRDEVQIGTVISTWPIFYSPGNQRGQITVYHDHNRAAIWCGGDSAWGDWLESSEIIALDDGHTYIDSTGKEIVEGDDFNGCSHI